MWRFGRLAAALPFAPQRHFAIKASCLVDGDAVTLHKPEHNRLSKQILEGGLFPTFHIGPPQSPDALQLASAE
jgi:hypothetical protein